ncbi:MAG: hypothetical protein ACRD2A_16765, partial [Vicinamibacterales bacterium]
MIDSQTTTIAKIANVLLIGTIALGTAATTQERPRSIGSGPERFETRLVSVGLDAPWELLWGPGDQLWVTERRGKRVLRVNPVDGSRSVM